MMAGERGGGGLRRRGGGERAGMSEGGIRREKEAREGGWGGEGRYIRNGLR